jgi:hypothetical protein
MRLRYYLEGLLWRISGKEGAICELEGYPAHNICMMLRLAYREGDEEKRKFYIGNAYLMVKRMDRKLWYYKGKV